MSQAKNAPAKPDRLAYPINEAAHLLGISRASVYRYAKTRQIKLIHIGERRLVPATEIDRLVAEGTR